MRYEDMTAEQQAEHDAAVAAALVVQGQQQAREAAIQMMLEDIPADEQSILAVKAKVNQILVILRGDN